MPCCRIGRDYGPSVAEVGARVPSETCGGYNALPGRIVNERVDLRIVYKDIEGVLELRQAGSRQGRVLGKIVGDEDDSGELGQALSCVSAAVAVSVWITALPTFPLKYILSRLVWPCMSSFNSVAAASLMAATAASERLLTLPSDGDHGANPMSTGRLSSTMVNWSATTAVATPFVVVWSRISVFPAAVALSNDSTWCGRANIRSF